MSKLLSLLAAVALIFSLALPCYALENEEEWEEYIDDPEPVTTPAPAVTEPPIETEPPITSLESVPGAQSSEPAISLPPIIFQFPETAPAAVEEVEDPAQVPAVVALYEGSGLYHILKEFIGVTFDSNQGYNEYQYLYPASVIIAVVLVVLVAKVIFSLVDRLL